jgi:hypothetical protein
VRLERKGRAEGVLNGEALTPEVVERVLEGVEARTKGRTFSTPSADLIEEARRERAEDL